MEENQNNTPQRSPQQDTNPGAPVSQPSVQNQSMSSQQNTIQTAQPVVGSFAPVQEAKKGRKGLLIGGIIVFVFFVAVVAGLALVNSSDSSSDSKESVNTSTDEEAVPASENNTSDTSPDAINARNLTRKTDITQIFTGLEVFHNKNAYYPASVTEINSEYAAADEEIFTDENGNQIISHAPVLDEDDALAVVIDSSQSEYLYVPFPEGCSVCTGYVLMSYMEEDGRGTENPYTKLGLNN